MTKMIDVLIGIWSMRPPPLSNEGKAWENGARQGWDWAVDRAAQIVGEWDHDGDPGKAMYARPRILDRILAMKK